jgi:hypothetical protein
VFPFVRTSAQYAIGNAEVATAAVAVEVAAAVDGRVDVVAVDLVRSGPLRALPEAVGSRIRQSRLILYSDEDAQVEAADAFLIRALPPPERARVVICGAGYIAVQLALRLAVRGVEIWIWRETAMAAARVCDALHALVTTLAPAPAAAVRPWTGDVHGVDAVVGATGGGSLVPASVVHSLDPDGVLLDAGVGSLTIEAIDVARTRGARLYRLDMRAGLAGAIAVALDTADLADRIVGHDVVAGIPIVAGGAIGQRGDVVVDAIDVPTRVVGVADGCGHLLADAQPFRARVERVEEELFNQRLRAATTGPQSRATPPRPGGRS